jgi:hypothetical protein
VEPASRLPAAGSGMVKFRGKVFMQAAGASSLIPPTGQPAAVDAEFSVYL